VLYCAPLGALQLMRLTGLATEEAQE